MFSYIDLIIYMCDLILEKQSSCHIWYFEKYQFQNYETNVTFLC